jgi:hypothetical protein
MFVDKIDIYDREYLCLLFLLREAEQAGATLDFQDVVKVLKLWMLPEEAVRSFETLQEKRLVEFYTTGGERPSRAVEIDGNVALTFNGFAFLLNHANEYVELMNNTYKELPDSLLTSLIPFLDLGSVPAADRFVSTLDNLPEFKQLEQELETIKLEIVKDKNKSDLAIPNKKAVLADIDAVLAQIKDGMVRLSDLTTRIRPIVRNIADCCKDDMVIGGAAGAAYVLVRSILSKVF